MTSASRYDESANLLLDSSQCAVRTRIYADEFYADLDPGIRFAVRVLHAHGIGTCQSCQGGDGHAYPEPTVDMTASGCDSQGFAALACLQDYGLPVRTVGIIWPVQNGLPYERLWRITFFRTMEDRADDKLMFFYGYQAQPDSANGG